MLLLITLVPPSLEAQLELPSRAFVIILLVGWYFSLGKPQVEFVKEKYGNNYERRKWGKPLLTTLVSIIGFLFLSAIINGVLYGIPE